MRSSLLLALLLTGPAAAQDAVMPAMGLWSSEQASAANHVCISHAIYDNTTDRDAVSTDAVAFLCGCVMGYWSAKVPYESFVANIEGYATTNPSQLADCKRKALATKPVPMHSKLAMLATPDQWAALAKESKTLSKGLLRLRGERIARPTVKSEAPSNSRSVIRLGQTYADVMAKLDGTSGTKSTAGAFLWVQYKEPSLVAYPDADGVCSLTFTNARLTDCNGCAPDRFKCD